MGSSFKAFLKLNLSMTFRPRFENAKQKRNFIITVVVLCVCFVPLIISLISAVYSMAGVSAQQGKVPELLSSIFLTSQISIVLLGLASFVGVMFFSKDNEIVATFPMTSTQVFAARFIVADIVETMLSALIILPMTIVSAVALHGAGVALTAWYYVLIPFAVILMPIIPMLIISLVSFPIVALRNAFKRHPTVGAVLAALLIAGIFLVIYIPMFTSGNFSGGGNADSPTDTTGITAVGGASYHTLIFAKAMLNVSPFGNLGIFVAIVLVGALLSGVLSMALYRKCTSVVIEGGGVGSSGKKGKDNLRSPTLAVMSKEFKTVMREGTLSMQNLMMLIMLPLMLFLFNKVVFSGEMAAQMEESNLAVGGFRITISAFFTMMMCGGANIMSSLAFSREGANFQTLKTLPTDFYTVFKAKELIAHAFSLVTIAVGTIVLIFVGGIGALDIVLFFVVCTLYTCAVNTIAMLRDLKNAKFDWTNIRELTHNNFATLGAMLIGIVGATIAFIVGLVLSIAAKDMNGYVFSAIFWGVALAITAAYTFVARYRLKERCLEYFERIEP